MPANRDPTADSAMEHGDHLLGVGEYDVEPSGSGEVELVDRAASSKVVGKVGNQGNRHGY